jgi:hypothetical protein
MDRSLPRLCLRWRGGVIAARNRIPHRRIGLHVLQHDVSGYGERRSSEPRRNLSRGSVDDGRGAMLLDQRAHALDSAYHRLAGTMPKPSHGLDDMMRACGFFRRDMSARIHTGDKERYKRIVRMARSVGVGATTDRLHQVTFVPSAQRRLPSP